MPGKIANTQPTGADTCRHGEMVYIRLVLSQQGNSLIHHLTFIKRNIGIQQLIWGTSDFPVALVPPHRGQPMVNSMHPLAQSREPRATLSFHIGPSIAQDELPTFCKGGGRPCKRPTNYQTICSAVGGTDKKESKVSEKEGLKIPSHALGETRVHTRSFQKCKVENALRGARGVGNPHRNKIKAQAESRLIRH